jgi:hypothetical protein
MPKAWLFRRSPALHGNRARSTPQRPGQEILVSYDAVRGARGPSFPDEIVNFNDSRRGHSALLIKVEFDEDTPLPNADERSSIDLPVRATKHLRIPNIHDVVSIHETMNGGFVGSWCQTLSDSRPDILYPYEAHAMNE